MWRWMVLALALLAPVWASRAAVQEPLPLDAFFSKHRIDGAALSPSGRYVATIQAVGDYQAVAVHDLQTGADTRAILLQGEENHIDWVRWKGDDRVIAGATWLKLYRFGKGPDSDVYDYSFGRYMISADREGKAPVVLFRDDKRTRRRLAAPDVKLLDPLRGDPTHVLAVAANVDGVLCVWKADILTGAAELVERGDSDTFAFLADGSANVVARYEALMSSVRIMGRAPGGHDWTEVARIRKKEFRTLDDFEFLGPAADPGRVYVAVEPASAADGPARRVRIYDFRTRTLSDPVWPPLKYDILDVVYRDAANELAGVCYVIDTYVCDFRDKTLQANFKGLRTFFHDGRNLARVSMSDDGKVWLLGVTGPDEPLSYYRYDMPTHQIDRLAVGRPDLPPERLGGMERFSYAARDGTPIPAYLTRPPGAPDGPLPLVVMPHGGPETRDSIDYDLWGQVLATRGYLVFQPNYRGSSGYGTDWAHAGYRQWGLKMQDDVTDGVKALIAQGRVDPRRICIVGASYGGYAALIGGAQNPDLYRCVVSLAGVSDLPAFVKWARRVGSGEDDPTYQYWVKAIGDPVKDRAVLDKASAVTWAKSYGPPVLLLHGLDDDVVPVEQSREMNDALKDAHKDVRLMLFKNEGHSYWDDVHEESALKAVIEFLDAHIGPAAAAH